MAKLLRFTVVVVVLLAATSIGAPSYTVTILHPSGFDNSFAVGISRRSAGGLWQRNGHRIFHPRFVVERKR